MVARTNAFEGWGGVGGRWGGWGRGIKLMCIVMCIERVRYRSFRSQVSEYNRSSFRKQPSSFRIRVSAYNRRVSESNRLVSEYNRGVSEYNRLSFRIPVSEYNRVVSEYQFPNTNA